MVRGEVDVAVRVDDDTLAATFTPRRKGFHVYSVDLPEGGVDGLGVRTDVSVRGGARGTGEPVADQPVRRLDYPTLGLRLPVYPDGPVTLTLRVRRGEGAPEVRVTYAACSESTCLVPVRELGRADAPLGPDDLDDLPGAAEADLHDPRPRAVAERGASRRSGWPTAFSVAQDVIPVLTFVVNVEAGRRLPGSRTRCS